MRRGILAALLVLPAFAADPMVRPALSYAKTFSGSGYDVAMAVAADAAGNAIVAGTTTSTDFPVANGFQMRMGGTPLRASTDGGKSWTVPAIPPGVNSIAGSSKLYAGTAAGVYRSLDSGRTWSALPSPSMAVGSILIDSTDPSTLYVAAPSGIWKVVDGGTGASWSPLFSTTTDYGPAGLFPNPMRPSTMFASLGYLLYRSIDSGGTWTQLTGMPYETISVVVDAVNPDTVYAAVWSVGVYRSLDGGDTWKEAAKLPVAYSQNAIAASPTALYLATSNGVMRSTDGGLRWSRTSITAAADVVAVDPNHPQTVYAAADQVYVSTDGGDSWTPLLTVPLHSVASITPAGTGLFIGSVLPQNIFVAKWSADGRMLWSTYLGGSYADYATGIASDRDGNLYVTGFSYSSDFPVTAGALRGKLAGPYNAFVTKISGDGSKILYSTLLGGSGGDSANAVAVDAASNAYVTGYTGSADFPVTMGVLQASLSQGCAAGTTEGDAFVSKIAPDGGSLVFSTYLGGTCADIGFGITVDSGGTAYVAGATSSPDFPVSTSGPSYDGKFNIGFLAKLTPAGDGLRYATFLGTGWSDVAQAVAVDDKGNAYVAGSSAGLDQAQPGPGSFVYGIAGSPIGLGSGGPAFVAKFDSSGARSFVTYLGECYDTGASIAVDNNGAVWVAGPTGGAPISATYFFGESLGDCFSANVPTVHPFQALQLGSGFVSKLSADGATVLFSSLLDSESGLALDPLGNVFVSGASRDSANRWPASLWRIDGNVSSPITIEEPRSKAMFPHSSGIFTPAAVAPGAVVVIPGTGLGPDQQAGSQITSAGTLATTIAGTSVTFGGVPAPLISVLSQQIVCIAPWELARSTITTVQVASNGSLSNAIRVPVTPTAAAILAVLNQDFTPNSKDNVAQPGSVITIYLAGLGPSDPPVPDGTINGPGAPMPKAPVDLSINWWLKPDILYMGPAPGQPAGIVQINFRIPQTIPGVGPWPAPPYDQYSLVAGTGDEFSGDHDVAPLWIR
jgi:uncharacterized protein (TIGR03437 family)